MPSTNEDGDDAEPDDRRRRLLGYAALAGGGVAGAWYVARRPRPPDPEPAPTGPTPTTTTTRDEQASDVPALVERYAPDLHFGALEKWYPTDPRAYVVETDAGPVVDGFTALDEYSAALAETGTPPAPTVFYAVTEAADGVDAVQYWLYSAFDQFTVNFHWHDWELLQVFVDRETGSPLLVSASAHARAIPNNEYVDPDPPEERRPAILAEVGSHSSASEINGLRPSFERVPTDGRRSDVTNGRLDVTRSLTAPFAYGLPRDEGARLPFVLPELDGERLDEHPALSVGREGFVDERATVDAWRGLPRPPADVPLREPGLVLAHADSPADADATYALEPIDAVRDAVVDFVGPQLSFEFAVPGFVENRIADHITSVGIPWKQDRFADPLADVTDPAHRQRIDGAEPPGLSNRVVGRVRHLRAGSDGALDRVTDDARDALADAISVSLYGLPVEVAVRLASEQPVATVTRNGAFGYLHVEPGPHLLAVDGPGYAPLAERFVHDGGLVRAGSDGDLALVAAEDAGWIRGDGRDATGIARVRVVEEYAGVVYDGRPAEADRFAVAVHRDGRYIVEVVDADGRPGAFRVGPDAFGDSADVVHERVETGKAALAAALRDETRDLRDLARSLAAADGSDGDSDDSSDGGGGDDAVLDRLSRAHESVSAAATAADRGDARAANEHLDAATAALTDARDLLSSDRRTGYGDAAVAALLPRVRAAIARADTASDTALA